MGAPYFSKSFGSHIPIIFSWRQEINIKIYLNNSKIFRKEITQNNLPRSRLWANVNIAYSWIWYLSGFLKKKKEGLNGEFWNIWTLLIFEARVTKKLDLNFRKGRKTIDATEKSV